MIFVTFLLSIPGIITPTRSWLKFNALLATSCGIFSLVLGLFLWILTLKTKEAFGPVWSTQTSQVQDLMQTAVSLPPEGVGMRWLFWAMLTRGQFGCCGYLNSTSPAFVTDPTCPSPAAAALMRGCATPIASFANVFVDDIFTGVFGMVGVDVVLIMAIACLLKERKERERYRHIDEKSGQI